LCRLASPGSPSAAAAPASGYPQIQSGSAASASATGEPSRRTCSHAALARERRRASAASWTSTWSPRPTARTTWSAWPSWTAVPGSASRPRVGNALADRARHQECVRSRGLTECALISASATRLKSRLVFGFLLFGCAGLALLAAAGICVQLHLLKVAALTGLAAATSSTLAACSKLAARISVLALASLPLTIGSRRLVLRVATLSLRSLAR
jgi:hypothetical protein